MRRLGALLFAGGLALGVGGLAQAATLPITSRSDLSLRISTLPRIVVPANGGSTLFVSSGTGNFTEGPGVFGPVNAPIPKSLFTGVPQISGLTITGLANGTMVFNAANGTATGALQGAALVTVLQSLNLTIPLSVVGAPGATVQAGAPGIFITVVGQGWTTGVAQVTGVTSTTPGTNVVNTVSMTGFDARTHAHGGDMVLVSGFQAITNVAGSLPGFAVHYLAPEPGALLVVGTGAICLTLYAYRKMRR